MCGIFGLINKSDVNNKTSFSQKILFDLARLSQSRGKDSSGICIRDDHRKEYKILKTNNKIMSLLKSKDFEFLFEKVVQRNKQFISFGHSRLVTNGSQLNQQNNQPIISNGIITIHNGIVVNSDKFFHDNKLEKKYEIDTEIIPALLITLMIIKTIIIIT